MPPLPYIIYLSLQKNKRKDEDFSSPFFYVFNSNYFFELATESFKALPTLNTGAFDAGIVISFPV